MENNKVLIVNAVNVGNRIQVPVGPIYLASNLKRHGYECEIYHVVDPKTREICKNKILNNRYLFVGFSFWMGPSALDLLTLAEVAKSRGMPTVAGGKFISSLKADTMSDNCLDIAGIGYCEDTIIEVAEALRGNRSLSSVSGIIYRDGSGKVITNPYRINANMDLDRYDYDLSFIHDWGLYVQRDQGGSILADPLESQRGCLFRCSFCFHSDSALYCDSKGKKSVSMHSVDYVIDKAKYLKRMTGINKLSFCDDEFWIDGNRSLIILEKLKQIGIGILFMRIRFSSIDSDMLKELKKLNVSSVACALESGSKRIFKLMNKGQTFETIEKKLKILNDEKMDVNTCIILGNPTETKEEMIESVRYTLGLRKINKTLNIASFVYAAIPGTVFGELAVKEGLKKPAGIRGWVETSSENHDILGQWLAWYNEREKRAMLGRYDYFAANSIVANLLYGKRSKSIYVRLLFLPLYLFERITYYRLYYWNFTFPLEVKLFMASFKSFMKICNVFRRFRDPRDPIAVVPVAAE